MTFRLNPALWLVLALASCSGEHKDDADDPAVEHGEAPLSSAATVSARLLPPDEKLLMFVGQDSDTISAYVREVPDTLEGLTLYTELKNSDPDKTLKAMFSRANWQAGDVDFDFTLSENPQAALAVGLAFDQCNQPAHGKAIANGQYDASIAKMLEYFGSLAPRKVFLRIGYEFDGPWNCYEPESYKAAYRHIFESIHSRGFSNIATVWQSAVWPDPSIAGPSMARYDHREPGMLDSWYPGDDVVDWVGISVFYRDLSQWNYTPPDDPDRAQNQLLSFARSHNKPVMIAEAAPQGYRTGALTRSPIQTNNPKPLSAEALWAAWYAPFFQFIYDNRDVIRAVAYINTHWESQPMWHCDQGAVAGGEGCANGNWGDTRVQGNPIILERWLNEVNNDSIWIQHADYD